MKVYQLKLCVRGNPMAMQTVIVEAEDYKSAMVKSITKLAQDNNIDVGQLAVQDIHVIEEMPKDNSVKVTTVELKVPMDGDLAPNPGALETIDILRVDAAGHKEREIVG